jgi:hypothetical protein
MCSPASYEVQHEAVNPAAVEASTTPGVEVKCAIVSLGGTT